MRNTLVAAASVLALAGTAAFAQSTANTEGKKVEATQPASGGAATEAAPATATTGTAATARTQTMAAAPNVARGSRLIGTSIENPNGDRIGEINDLVIDPKTGQIRQVIVGVGGFLGIGEKDVALNWDQLQIQRELETERVATMPPPGAPGATTTPAPGSPAARPGDMPATERSTATPAAGAPAAERDAAPMAARTTRTRRTDDLRVTVNMTKEQLQQAPDFEFEDEQAETRSATGRVEPAPDRPAPSGSTTR